MKIEISAIGIARSPYKEKFAIPRQPGLAPSVKTTIEFLAPYNDAALFDGIKQHSHLWVEFLFHQNISQGWSPKVRPPRLGGNKKLGVFATRSSFRPNGLGLSVGKLLELNDNGGQVRLVVQGLDLLDGTPVVDIKPYLPYADSIDDAQAGFAQAKPEFMKVSFTEQAIEQSQSYAAQCPELLQVITEVLSQDPRPAYKKNDVDGKTYGVRLFDVNVKWQVIKNENRVVAIEPIKD